jgi:thiosulfate oxidation carrier complex protein SoxZ
MATPVLSRLSFSGELRPGRTVEARWICNHPMETGFRVDDSGQRIARHIITQVQCRLNGQVILQANPGTGWSSPAYLAFSLVVPEQGGTVAVSWLDDQGAQGQVEQRLVLLP